MAMNELQVLQKKADIEKEVKGKVANMLKSRQLVLPENYNVGNALTDAMLILQDTKDANKRPVLEVCTQASIGKCLLDMVSQGLQPGKKQCYFIAYSDQLTLFRSYFGTVVALKQVNKDVAHVTAEVIRKGDEVVYGRTRFGERFVDYISSEPLVNASNEIVAGYCNIYNAKGEILGSTIMTWAEIQTSWRQSRNYKAEGGVHQKFTAEMAKRTLVARACKFLLNTSLDQMENSVGVKAFNDTTDSEFDMEVQNEIKPEQKKLGVKERLGIGQKTETPKEDPTPKEEEPVTGPEDFDDAPFDEEDDNDYGWPIEEGNPQGEMF